MDREGEVRVVRRPCGRAVGPDRGRGWRLDLGGEPGKARGRPSSGLPAFGWESGGEAGRLDWPPEAPGWDLGFSVAMADGGVVAGGMEEDPARRGFWRGAGYLFAPRSSGWVGRFEPSAKLVDDGFGWSELGSAVALEGTTAVLGAPFGLTELGPFDGKALVYDVAPGLAPKVPATTFPGIFLVCLVLLANRFALGPNRAPRKHPR